MIKLLIIIYITIGVVLTIFRISFLIKVLQQVLREGDSLFVRSGTALFVVIYEVFAWPFTVR